MARSYAASTSSACSSTCVYSISISSWRCWFSRSSSLSRRWSMAFSVKRCCTCFVSCSSPSLRRLAEDGDRSAETSRSTEDAASLRSSVFARYSFATSLFSTLITPMRGASCGHGAGGRGIVRVSSGAGLLAPKKNVGRGRGVGESAHLRQDLQLHHLAAPPEHLLVIIKVAQDVLPVLRVQLQRVVRGLCGGHAQHLDLVPGHDELVRGAEQPGGGDEPSALGVDVQRAQQVDAVAAGHDVAAVPAVRALGLGPRGRHRGGRHHGRFNTGLFSTPSPSSTGRAGASRGRLAPRPASPFVRSRSDRRSGASLRGIAGPECPEAGREPAPGVTSCRR